MLRSRFSSITERARYGVVLSFFFRCALLFSVSAIPLFQSAAFGETEVSNVHDVLAKAKHLLKTGNVEAAIPELNSIRGRLDDFNDNSERADFFYTYGRALEEDEKRGPAIDAYMQAVDLDKNFRRRSYESSFSVMMNYPSSAVGLSRAIDFLEERTKAGELASAERFLHQAFTIDSWPKEAGYHRLLLSLIRFLTKDQTSPSTYQENWKSELVKINEKLPPRERLLHWDSSKEMLEQIDNIYLEEDPGIFGEKNARRTYINWREMEEGKDFGAFIGFLRMVGDSYLEKSDEGGAIRRYSLAWALDKHDAESALDFASWLLTNWNTRESHGYHKKEWGQFQDSLMGTLLSVKRIAYKEEDWPNILRLHSVFAALLEKEDRIGPPEDPHTATFQLIRAVKAHSKLTAETWDDLEHVPQLYHQLGSLYKRLALEEEGEERNELLIEAWGHYLNAAEHYFASDRPSDAEKMTEIEVSILEEYFEPPAEAIERREAVLETFKD